MGDLDLLDKLYDGILLSVADVMAAFPGPDEGAVAAEAVETTAPAEKSAPIMSVATTVPFTPKGGGVLPRTNRGGEKSAGGGRCRQGLLRARSQQTTRRGGQGRWVCRGNGAAAESQINRSG